MRRVLMVLLACSSLVAFATRPIAAAEPPPTAEAVAAQVKAAHAAGEADRIRELAAQEAPDPWLVADALLATGAGEAAAAFAKAAAGKDVAEVWLQKPDLERAQAEAEGAIASAQSLEHCLRAQKLYEGLGQKDGAAASLMNAAHATLRLGRLEECKGHAERAVSLAREIGSPGIAGHAQYTLGEVAERQKQADQALAAFTAALASFEEVKDRVEAARTLAAVADALRALGQLPRAREQVDRALRDGEALENPGVVAYALYVGTKVRRDQGLRQEALDFARRSLAAYTGLKHSRGVAEMQALVKELEAVPAR